MHLSGSPFDFVLAFLGGILISFSPCIYPLIPISAGYIGVKAGGSKLKGLSLSLVYVTGVACAYSVLGLIAAFTGTLFGRISASPFTSLFVGCVVIVFGLSLLDLFVFPLPRILKLPVHTQRNYLSTFLLGLSSGLVASPCLTPVLGSILVYVAAKRSLWYGATLLFSFAYGMGFLLILVGTFSAAIINLPKSGQWLVYAKRASAAILIGAGFYFIYHGIRGL